MITESRKIQFHEFFRWFESFTNKVHNLKGLYDLSISSEFECFINTHHTVWKSSIKRDHAKGNSWNQLFSTFCSKNVDFTGEKMLIFPWKSWSRFIAFFYTVLWIIMKFDFTKYFFQWVGEFFFAFSTHLTMLLHAWYCISQKVDFTEFCPKIEDVICRTRRQTLYIEFQFQL